MVAGFATGAAAVAIGLRSIGDDSTEVPLVLGVFLGILAVVWLALAFGSLDAGSTMNPSRRTGITVAAAVSVASSLVVLALVLFS
jgi:hypothetical protein